MRLVIQFIKENLVNICDQQFVATFLYLNISCDIQVKVLLPSLNVLIFIPSKLEEQNLLRAPGN